MLYDKNFLMQLDSYPHKVVYARITALTYQETPIEYIEGRVTQGSINVDGSSAVRRTCSLTVLAQDFNYNNFYWGLNSKFKLEIGLENNINSIYPNIIWFKQGVYLITSFSTSRNSNSFSISIQGKDKMCLLNGDVGGSLESSVDFGTIEEEDINGNWVIKKISISDIIKNMIHNYGGEPYWNIVINDLETQGLELLEYRYDKPLYLCRKIDKYVYENAFIGGSNNTVCKIYKRSDLQNPLEDIVIGVDKNNNAIVKKELLLDEIPIKYFETLTDDLLTGEMDGYVMTTGAVDLNNQPIYYYFTKIEYGQTAGYRLTDLTFAGDLIANVGESLTSVLDKIKNMLVEFEYFYNLDGQFVFQKKRSLKEAIWQFNKEDKAYSPADYSYEFYGTNLITALSNNPNLLNLKNDYSIWGERNSLSGAKIPIHLRYAIDTKPIEYNSINVSYGELELDQNGNVQYDDQGNKRFRIKGKDADAVEAYNKKYNTAIKGQESKKYSIQAWDWREIIYQMALDYYKYNFLDDFELKVAAANPDLYPTGRTGYEQYYRDLQGFWRELYNPEIVAEETQMKNKILLQEESVIKLKEEVQELTNQLNHFDLTPVNPGEAPPIDTNDKIQAWLERAEKANLLSKKQAELEKIEEQLAQLKTQQAEDSIKWNEYYDNTSELKYWNKTVHLQPELLNFWFDFLDSRGELEQFNVKTIGNRAKVINDNNIKSIYFRETPSIIYKSPDQILTNDEMESGYRYLQLPVSFDNMFTVSAQGLSAKNKLDELLYQHGYCIDSANITTIPIYHLEPNTRIYLNDLETRLSGDYIVSKITIPLTYNGTMSITATKAAENNIM